MTLDGQRIVVLGGSSGIGLAIAQAAGREGASVVIASSQQPKVDAALAVLPGAEGHAVDFGSASSIEGLFDRLGPFDHLAYTAGEALALGKLADTDPAAAQRFFAIRYWGAFFAAKFGAPAIRPGGSIVFTSGTAGRRPRAGWALGASICMAMEGLTRALAVELAPIRVNLVIPGLVKTPLWAGMAEADREALYQGAAASLPTGHVGTAEEVAESYLYFMRQTYSTGQSVVVDGGGLLV
jgi:NAD(P)-dependent dehydrogenase (short-subunit alcohol dehydrogenase family)